MVLLWIIRYYMVYHKHVCVYLYLLPKQTAHMFNTCLYPSIVFRAYTACTCTCMHSTCTVHVHACIIFVVLLDFW